MAIGKFAVVVGFTLGSLVWLHGCLRLAEPEVFSCEEDSECVGDERCLSSENGPVCRTPLSCGFEEDCGVDQICRNSKCVTVGCTDRSDCGLYRCDTSIHECPTSCALRKGRCVAGATCVGSFCSAN